MSNLLEQVHDVIDSVLGRVRVDARALLDRAGTVASRAGLTGLWGGIAALGVLVMLAAVVVALTPLLGPAGALASVGGLLLLCGGTGVLVLRQRASKERSAAEQREAAGKLANARPTGSLTAGLNGKHTPQAMPEAVLPPPGTPAIGSALEHLPKFDPIFVAASVGALAALLGPSRLVRLLGVATSGIAMAQRLAPLGEMIRMYKATQEVNELSRGLREYTESKRSAAVRESARGVRTEREYANL